MRWKNRLGGPAVGLLTVWIFLLAALSPGQARGEEVAAFETPQPAAPPVQTVVLEPFYFFREKDSGVWVERLLVRLEVPGNRDATEFNAPRHRDLLQEILEFETDAAKLSARALAGLQKHLGSHAVRDLQVSRSTLILR